MGIFSQATIDRAKQVVSKESGFEEVKSESGKVEILLKYSEALYLILSFERLYNVIFGSQLNILEHVNTYNSETKESLKRFYDSSKQQYPEFYATYTYDEYFKFLLSMETITLNEKGQCQITWLGRDFLKYIVETGKSLNKSF